MLVGCAAAAALFPFIGTIVYMIVRPPEYIEDRRERELEIQAAEARLHEQDVHFCPHCEFQEMDVLLEEPGLDRKSTRLNSSHMSISYAVFCLKKKKHEHTNS